MRTNLNARLLKYRKREKKIFIQIDGLAYQDMLMAIRKGKLPTLKKLLEKKGYYLTKLFSELPSNTPAAQMKLMYGIKNKIKGFRWYDKIKEEEYSFKTPKTANYWENVAKKESKEELLEDGASYINLYTGGASRSILSLSKMFETNIKTRVENTEIWKFIFLNADLVLRMSYKLGRELIRETYENLKYKIKKKPQRSFFSFPYIRLVNNVFLKEIATIGTKLEMDEGYKRIYITYTAYDEMGHTRGPQTKEAMNTLKDIDKGVKRILKNASKKGYDVYIFSDHGQTPAIPFEKKYGITLKRLIQDVIVKHNMTIEEYSSKYERSKHIYMYGVKTILRNAAKLGYKFIENIGEKILKQKEDPIEEGIEKGDLIVMNSGPFSHIYFKNLKYRLSKDEINEKVPELIKILKEHPGIEFLVVKNNLGYELLTSDEIIPLNENFEMLNKKEENKDYKLFKKYDLSQKKFLYSLSEISLGDGVGDIIIFGALIEKNKIINFEEQYGAHGGLGGNQNVPFLITNKNIKINEGNGISVLYDVFRGYVF